MTLNVELEAEDKLERRTFRFVTRDTHAGGTARLWVILDGYTREERATTRRKYQVAARYDRTTHEEPRGAKVVLEFAAAHAMMEYEVAAKVRPLLAAAVRVGTWGDYLKDVDGFGGTPCA